MPPDELLKQYMEALGFQAGEDLFNFSDKPIKEGEMAKRIIADPEERQVSKEELVVLLEAGEIIHDKLEKFPKSVQLQYKLGFDMILELIEIGKKQIKPKS